MKKEFYSNGKLLITGEYVVLDGAKAFALPTKYGQKLTVTDDSGNVIHWKSYDYDGSIWFEATIAFESIVKGKRFDATQSIKNTLIEILHEAYKTNSDFITKSTGYSIVTELSFSKNWGLGTSSTLINNIAQWIGIDAFQLLRNSFGGSGYDIACASNNTPILYQLENELPIVTPIHFNPDFTKNIYFIYLNSKQNSKNAIAEYLRNRGELSDTIDKINALTDKISNSIDFHSFSNEIKQHEIELSNLLAMSTVQETLFADFDGVVKSLGAWGGDFVMALSATNPTDYFNSKGFNVVLNYHQMIL